jgi:hypothetical protein
MLSLTRENGVFGLQVQVVPLEPMIPRKKLKRPLESALRLAALNFMFMDVMVGFAKEVLLEKILFHPRGKIAGLSNFSICKLPI